MRGLTEIGPASRYKSVSAARPAGASRPWQRNQVRRNQPLAGYLPAV